VAAQQEAKLPARADAALRYPLLLRSGTDGAPPRIHLLKNGIGGREKLGVPFARRLAAGQRPWSGRILRPQRFEDRPLALIERLEHVAWIVDGLGAPLALQEAAEELVTVATRAVVDGDAALAEDQRQVELFVFVLGGLVNGRDDR